MTNDTPAFSHEEEIPACCGTCFCYRPVTEQGGLCLRRPPQVIIMMVPDPSQAMALVMKPGEVPRPKTVPQAQGQWPPVPLQGWCYEYVDSRDEAEPLGAQQVGIDS